MPIQTRSGWASFPRTNRRSSARSVPTARVALARPKRRDALPPNEAARSASPGPDPRRSRPRDHRVRGGDRGDHRDRRDPSDRGARRHGDARRAIPHLRGSRSPAHAADPAPDRHSRRGSSRRPLLNGGGRSFRDLRFPRRPAVLCRSQRQLRCRVLGARRDADRLGGPRHCRARLDSAAYRIELRAAAAGRRRGVRSRCRAPRAGRRDHVGARPRPPRAHRARTSAGHPERDRRASRTARADHRGVLPRGCRHRDTRCMER